MDKKHDDKDELSRADAKKVLEQTKQKLMESLNKNEDVAKHPELVERVNQIINDLEASIPADVPAPQEPGAKMTREEFAAMIDKAEAQAKASLDQTEEGKKLAGEVSSALEAAKTAKPEEEKKEPAAAPKQPPAHSHSHKTD